jgi:N utilization substance protein A
MNHELVKALSDITRDKGIAREILIDAIEAALLSAYKRNFGFSENVVIDVNSQTGDIKVFSLKKVFEGSSNLQREMGLEETRDVNPEAKLGDAIKIEITPKDFGRIAIQTAKQVMIQKIREAKRENIYQEYKDRVGEVCTGVVRQREYGAIIIDLGKVEAILPFKEQVHGEELRSGDRIKTYILEVTKTNRGPQILVSRSHPNLVCKLFEVEVPEIYDGVVKIMAIAREAGSRTKVAVWSADEKVDPVGACVGIGGSRVQSICKELSGEKIDIISYSEDPAVFVSHALSPANVSDVILHERERAMEVIIVSEQISLAIGKKGRNVRLAAKLTGWKIDVKTPEEIKEAALMAMNLTDLSGVGPKTAQRLRDSGFGSIGGIAKAKLLDLIVVPSVGKATAKKILAAAKKIAGPIQPEGREGEKKE